MAYAQLSAVHVRDAAAAATAALKETKDESSRHRVTLEKLRWLHQLAAASAQEDETHRYVTATAEDFSLIAEHYPAAAADAT